MNRVRLMVSEWLMRLAMLVDPTGDRAETAVPPGMDRRMGPRPRAVPPQPPSTVPDAVQLDVPSARRPRPGRRTEP